MGCLAELGIQHCPSFRARSASPDIGSSHQINGSGDGLGEGVNRIAQSIASTMIWPKLVAHLVVDHLLLVLVNCQVVGRPMTRHVTEEVAEVAPRDARFGVVILVGEANGWNNRCVF